MLHRKKAYYSRGQGKYVERLLCAVFVISLMYLVLPFCNNFFRNNAGEFIASKHKQNRGFLLQFGPFSGSKRSIIIDYVRIYIIINYIILKYQIINNIF